MTVCLDGNGRIDGTDPQVDTTFRSFDKAVHVTAEELSEYKTDCIMVNVKSQQLTSTRDADLKSFIQCLCLGCLSHEREHLLAPSYTRGTTLPLRKTRKINL